MKQIIWLVFVSVALNASAQNLIPNAQLEQWMNIGGWYENPVAWQTSNNQIVAQQVFKDSIAHGGNYAMTLQTIVTSLIPWAKCGFPLIDHPVYLEGYIAQNMSVGDSAFVRIHIYHQGLLVDSGIYIAMNGINPGYVQFSIPISTNSNVADSAEIIVNGCRLYNDAISLDDLQLVFLLGENELRADAFEIYPVPSAGQVFVRSQINDCNFYLFDAYGKLVYSTTLANGITNLNLQLDNGVYFTRGVSQNKIIHTGRLIVSK